MPGSQMTVSRIGGTVRLTISPKVAFNLDALQRGLKSLAGRLGCEQCATGCDILHLTMERDFALRSDATVNVEPLASHQYFGLPQDPVPLRPVTVFIPDKVNGSIDLLNRAIANTLGKLGCEGCCSGFDIYFQRYLNTLVINERAEISAIGH